MGRFNGIPAVLRLLPEDLGFGARTLLAEEEAEWERLMGKLRGCCSAGVHPGSRPPERAAPSERGVLRRDAL